MAMTAKKSASKSRFVFDTRSISTRLISTFVLMVLFPSLLIGTMTAWVGLRSGLDQVYRQLDSVASLKATSIDSWIKNLETDLTNALNPEGLRWHVTVLLQQGESLELFRAASFNRVNADINKQLRQSRRFDELFFVNLDGAVVYSTDAQRIGKNYRKDPFFIDGQKQFEISSPMILESGQKHSVFASLPVTNGGGQLMGVLVGRASMSHLNGIMLSRQGLGETGETFLVSSAGVLLTEARFEFDKGNVINESNLNANFQNRVNSQERYQNYLDLPVIGAHHWIPQLNVVLVAEKQQSEAFEPTYVALRLSVAVVFISILIAITIGILLTRNITAPLASLSKAASLIATGNIEMEVAHKGSTEVRQLVDAFNSMLKRIRDLIDDVKQKETQQRDLLNNSATVIYMKQPDGRYLFINKTFEKLFKISNEEIRNKVDADIFPSSISDILEANDATVLEYGSTMEFEERIPHEDVEHVYISVKFPLKDEAGEIYAICGISTDITDRNHAEEERVRLMMAINQAVETILITDIEGNIQFVNPAHERTSGYLQNEVVGQNIRLLKSGQQEPEFFMKMWETLNSGKTWSGRIINKKKDGTLFTEEATISPVRDAMSNVVNYVAVKRDVSHEINLEDQLRQSQKMDAVGQLAGGIAHDFNNLLQVIQGYTEIVLDNIGEDSPEYGELSEVMSATTRSVSLVRQLLAFSRLQALQMTDFNLDEVVDNALKLLRRVIGEHISLSITLGQLNSRVTADRGQVDQILMNLCVNARDAMPDGGEIKLTTKEVQFDAHFAVVHPWAEEGDYVQLSVIDTGCGMNEDTLSKIFDPFFTTKGVGEGTGLGLSTVFGIVKQHKGLLNVESELGKGTAFHIYFPIVDYETTVDVEQPKQEGPPGSETILVAEDELSVRKLTEIILANAGYKVLLAEDGPAAVRLFDAHAAEIDLALLDVMMPGLSGQRVCDHIRTNQSEIPVIFVSGYSVKIGMNSVDLDMNTPLIQKPYDRYTLLLKVRELLDARRS